MKAKYILVFLVLFCLPLQSFGTTEAVEDYSHDEALRLGEIMYRSGVLPSGQAMKALVMGDIPVDGRMFTCDDCHQRSGLGSEEGTIITWPTNGKELFVPRRGNRAYKLPVNEDEKLDARRELPKFYQMEDVRPAYTDKSLARVLRVGVDPAGRKLDPIMPKYRLSGSNMRILIYYLKHLSVELSPGVDDTTLQFATVITDDVAETDKTAMLSVLQAHIDARNSESRPNTRRSASGPFYKSEQHKAYRKLKLHVWSLQGPEETWRDQLDSYYSKQPVFALLGGITGGSWEKIHTFSEENKIPCIFPITDLPAISESDWYTLYFSKGYYQEGESVAKYIRANLKDEKTIKIVQVQQQGNQKSSALAQGFEQTWQKMGKTAVENILLQGDQVVTDQMWNDILDGPAPVVLLIWLDGANTDIFKNLTHYADQVQMMFASATLLDNNFSFISDQLKENLLVTDPYSMLSEDDPTRFSVERWLQIRKIPQSNFNIQAKMYFLGWMLPGSIKNMRSEFFREYFLEGYDMMVDQDYAIAVYPRLTFGPAQRYASKGCYISKLTKGANPELVPVSDWVTY
ncbi:MAG: amino acid ABC transporter substrate-binding protein [Desulfobulbaceae bacterium]|nr:amino acid ABC transporter substrate-binding protein [Desulfobulbaceae bacterium]